MDRRSQWTGGHNEQADTMNRLPLWTGDYNRLVFFIMIINCFVNLKKLTDKRKTERSLQKSIE